MGKKRKPSASPEYEHGQELAVLYEDNHLLVLSKPSGLPTMGAPGRETLFDLACDYIREKYHKPGKVYLGVVQRLDAFSSGCIVFARTSKAAARLSEQIRSRKIQKVYRVVVEGNAAKQLALAGTLEDYTSKNESAQRMQIVPKSANSQQAILHYQLLAATDRYSVLEINLETGRKHQIRVQFSSRGLPVWGDAKYGGQEKESSCIALHCYQLQFHHPTTKAELTFTADIPAWWKQKFPESLNENS